ncbi:BTAD domain-containing putative transcriptional regulator [Sporosarcina sp. Te-1]|uniref:BTAD domain-containing putative transcriptional regulator n=1 Tax=Sporosarcina sp. Te-1 TaxID=2818390 RepID=UPI001A9D0CAF|nr:BTAD domain-containing putative transcriptional regulator [Sporosarcina sp. Te-1]QTD40851.1 response regulator [Sporosarcina sp. Te-1]
MIRAIIVDDEQHALRHLEKKLIKTNRVEVVGMYTNATDVLKDLKNLSFDVAFLDIELPGLSGLDLADLLTDWNKDLFIVFVTAYRDYAVQAFELHSIDYLLKPIMLERLEKTTMRIEEQIKLRSKEDIATPIEQSSLKIICFNEFHVYYHNTPVKWKTAKVKELFAFFFTHLHDTIQRDLIIETLWPEVEYQRAKIQLHTTMSYLRKMLDAMGFSKAITFSNGCYTLRIDRFECDAQQFEKLLEDTPVVTDDTIGMFEEIVSQYSGDYMESNGYEWALPKAHAIRQKLLHLLQMLINHFAQRGATNKIQQYLQLLVSCNPYSEHAVQQLMRFYVQIGNRGEAVKVYHDMKTLLIEELGILPDQSTTKLYDSILNG